MNKITVLAELCLLQKDPGPCRGSVLRWYYDDKVKDCRQFFYGGCLGNNNRFKTQDECKKKCPILDYDKGILLERENINNSIRRAILIWLLSRRYLIRR